jgi:death on curing protein
LVLIPTLNVTKNIHDVVIKDGGERGIKSEGILIACLERPFTKTYGYEAFPTIFKKAAALLHSIAGPFHPFIDGNKRTALVLISLFLWINGYSFTFPKDSVEFTLSIAKGEIKSIRKISIWIKKTCAKNSIYALDDYTRLLLLNDINFPVSDRNKIILQLKKG